MIIIEPLNIQNYLFPTILYLIFIFVMLNLINEENKRTNFIEKIKYKYQLKF